MTDERQGVEGHEPMPKGKTAQDWSYRAHCKRDGEPWPCRTVLLHRVAALAAQVPAPEHEGACGPEDPCNRCLGQDERRRLFEAGRATGTVEGWADYTEQVHEDEYDALARQFHESIAEGQSVALTAKALRILALPAQEEDRAES